MESTILDRKIAPVIRPISNIRWPELEQLTFGNGMPVTIIRNNDQPIIQIELINNAGRILEMQRLASRTTASLLKEGAGGDTGRYISEQVDYYGGSLVTSGTLDVARAQLFTLSRYEAEVIPYLAAVWQEPDFREDEFLLLKQNRVQKLQEDLRNIDNVSYRAITEYIFGVGHPYGYNSTEGLYQRLSLDDVRQHYDHCYGHDNTQVIITGNVTDDTIRILESYVGSYTKAHRDQTYMPPRPIESPQRVHVPLTDNYQSSIKIGRRLFNRQHPDYAGVFVLNVILGGYFGSRLMSSIREDLGYTYNIYSSMGTLMHDGFFYISTDVDHKYVDLTIEEIFRQMEILQTDLVPRDELKMVKNYILGHFLGMLDGPFNISQLVKSYMVHGLTKADFYSIKDTVNTITAEQLLRLAQQYLQAEDFITVTVGA